MKVLFVEDNAINRRVVGDMLKVAGLAMTEAENAMIGLDLLDREDFDLVLMDIRMPGMDGLEATRHIRARGDAKAQVPLIVVTADTAADLREQCEDCGADDLIMKPVSLAALFDTIGRVMALKNPGAALA